MIGDVYTKLLPIYSERTIRIASNPSGPNPLSSAPVQMERRLGRMREWRCQGDPASTVMMLTDPRRHKMFPGVGQGWAGLGVVDGLLGGWVGGLLGWRADGWVGEWEGGWCLGPQEKFAEQVMPFIIEHNGVPYDSDDMRSGICSKALVSKWVSGHPTHT
jgi:hypothetical protein